MNFNSNIMESAPLIKTLTIEITPIMTPEQLEMLTNGLDAVVLKVYATGTSPESLNEVIKKRTKEGIPIFLVSNNPGDNHGILKITYDTQKKSNEAGAIPLEKVNVNNLDVIYSSLQSEFAKGKRGAELGEAIREKFAYNESEPKPIPAWDDQEKIKGQEFLYRTTLKRGGNLSEVEINEIIRKWRGDK